MVRKVDKTKLLTVVGIIIFLFGGAVRIFSHHGKYSPIYAGTEIGNQK